MDGDIGDHKKIPLNVHEPFGDRAVFAHEHAPGDGERAVEPRGYQHPAVLLGRELDIMRAASVRMLF